jgi:hypothetical protein
MIAPPARPRASGAHGLVEAGLGQDKAGPGERPYPDHGVVLIDDRDRLGFLAVRLGAGLGSICLLVPPVQFTCIAH